MKKYDPKSKCPKCGDKKVNTYYCRGDKYTYGTICGGEDTEHLHRNCQKCHYEWLEAVLERKRSD